MDLTEIAFLSRIRAETPASSRYELGYFFTTESAVVALKRSWKELNKSLGYTTFFIEEILIGEIINNKAKLKCCFTIKNNDLEEINIS